ncbi:MAG TPA: hypothetical protein VN519_10680 [Bryobacteraceae bacterium]|nr:hypothetical protein [Bryobacteraceae bacterium]
MTFSLSVWLFHNPLDDFSDGRFGLFGGKQAPLQSEQQIESVRR